MTRFVKAKHVRFRLGGHVRYGVITKRGKKMIMLRRTDKDGDRWSKTEMREDGVEVETTMLILADPDTEFTELWTDLHYGETITKPRRVTWPSS